MVAPVFHTIRPLPKPEFCSNSRRLTDEERSLLGVNKYRRQSNNKEVGQKAPFQKGSIGLLNSHSDIHNTHLLKDIHEYLSAQQCTVYLADNLAEHFPHTTELKFLSLETLAQRCDLLISIGGDGSLLQTARLAVKHGTAVLGINRGRLGFLADIRPQDFKSQLSAILNGHYQEESRFFLEVKIMHHHVTIAEEIALNEAALVSGDIAQMIEYHLSINQQFMCAQRADGLIISTPTGSTAYALSAGGPILHPELNALVIVPMFSHSLNVRPIVVNANSTLTLQVTHQRGQQLPGLTCDGRPRIPFPLHATITIQKKEQVLRLIHPPHYQYFEALRSKLQWQIS